MLFRILMRVILLNIENYHELEYCKIKFHFLNFFSSTPELSVNTSQRGARNYHDTFTRDARSQMCLEVNAL